MLLYNYNDPVVPCIYMSLNYRIVNLFPLYSIPGIEYRVHQLVMSLLSNQLVNHLIVFLDFLEVRLLKQEV